MKQLLKTIFVAGMALAMVGCSFFGGENGAEVQLNIGVGKQVNPDPSGRASPLVIKVYQLNDKLAFETKDFFSIYDATDKDVKKAIVEQKEYQLNPGHEIHQSLVTNPATQYIGIVAAFRDIEIAKWRAVAKVNPGDEHSVTFTLDGVTIEVSEKEL
ncbi:MAG: type VI secretion system lipoprotein TssJ [Rickettsiales bacterium]|nr:type VI secretion system lipoprotein TssJ [Rickettsiales bacterium]